MTDKQATGTSEENSEPSWPPGVQKITLGGLARLGVQAGSNRLYWDGEEVVTKRVVRLGTLETWLAIIGVGTGVASFVHEVGKTAGYW